MAACLFIRLEQVKHVARAHTELLSYAAAAAATLPNR